MFSKAPWTDWSSKDQSDGNKDASLTTVLTTTEQRSALTLLVADCTEVMRQSILDTFNIESSETNVQKLIDLDDNHAVSADRESLIDLEGADPEKVPQEVALKKAEVDNPQTQELKDAALKYFDEWRTSVIQRVGEVVNSREEPHKPTSQNTSPNTGKPNPQVKGPELPRYDKNVEDTMRKLYPPVNNTLRQLPEATRVLILHSILLLLLSLEHYQAPSRVLLLRLTTSLDLPLHLTTSDESKIASGLLSAVENMNADDEQKKKVEDGQGARRWKVGLAAVAGAALIGVTGGLAAPLLAAGIGSVMGGLGLGATAAAGYLGSLAGSAVLVGGLFGAYGGRMTSQMMDKYAREVEDFAFVPVRSHRRTRKSEKESRRLRVAIGISGWLTDQKEVYEPWKILGSEVEAFALQFEVEAMMGMGNSMMSLVTSVAWNYAKREIISRTIFATLQAGLWPLNLLKVSRVLDNPFTVGNYRATKAGEVLADAIINKAQGERPVTLIGYSLGAKVIFTCLQKLAERKAFGLIESVVLIGTPASSTPADWRKIRSVVSGRVVNVYSEKDYMLGFLYRSQSIRMGVAGLQAIERVPGVENLDVSEICSGHTSYRFLTGTILDKIGFEDIDAEQLKLERDALALQEAKEEDERVKNELKEKAKHTGTNEAGQLGDSQTKTENVSDDTLFDLEQEIEKKNEQSYVGWAQNQFVSAGASASSAYQKATASWRSKKEGDVEQSVDRPPAATDVTKSEHSIDERTSLEVQPIKMEDLDISDEPALPTEPHHNLR